MYIFGKHSIELALQVTKDSVRKIYSEQGKNSLLAFGEIAEGIKVEELPKWKLDQLSKGGNHQGFVAEIESFPLKSERELKGDLSKIERGLILIADGILDTHNLGAMMRTLAAANGFCILLPQNRSAPISGATIHASAGTAFLLNVYLVKNLARSIEYLKEAGFWIFGLDLNSKNSLLGYNFPSKTAIAIGGEDKGLRRIIKRSCDELLKIPQSARADSLNASVAAAIAIYEYVRINAFNK